jgi:hypothetical protein
MRRWLRWTAAALLLAGGCYRIPKSVRTFAADLPTRADGQYAVLEDPLKKQLVTKDALLQCRIDLEDGTTAADSAACRCSTSASEDWVGDCRAWLGAHAPSQTPTPGDGT